MNRDCIYNVIHHNTLQNNVLFDETVSFLTFELLNYKQIKCRGPFCTTDRRYTTKLCEYFVSSAFLYTLHHQYSYLTLFEKNNFVYFYDTVIVSLSLCKLLISVSILFTAVWLAKMFNANCVGKFLRICSFVTWPDKIEAFD